MTRTFLRAMNGAEAIPPTVITGLTTHGTTNTRKEIAHSLAYTPSAAIPVLDGTDDDSAENPLGAVIEIVAIDATNVTVKSVAIVQPFHLVCFP